MSLCRKVTSLGGLFLPGTSGLARASAPKLWSDVRNLLHFIGKADIVDHVNSRGHIMQKCQHFAVFARSELSENRQRVTGYAHFYFVRQRKARQLRLES